VERSALYIGEVVHQRLRPRRHRLRYRVFWMLLDLDDLTRLHRTMRLFSHNRRNVFAFHDRDHGPGDGTPLRGWIDDELTRAGIELDGGQVRVLCFPRVLGMVFNPISVFFCHHRHGDLAAILYEVHNTFGERHGYLIPLGEDDRAAPVVRQHCAKAFYVSPFIAVDGEYGFRTAVPGERAGLAITLRDGDGPLLYAAMSGRRQPLTNRSLATMLFRFPLLAPKVLGAIHWEALKLWRKGIPMFRRPAPPVDLVGIERSARP